MTANNWCIFFWGGGGLVLGHGRFWGFSLAHDIGIVIGGGGGEGSFTPPRILRCDYLPPAHFGHLTWKFLLFNLLIDIIFSIPRLQFTAGVFTLTLFVGYVVHLFNILFITGLHSFKKGTCIRLFKVRVIFQKLRTQVLIIASNVTQLCHVTNERRNLEKIKNTCTSCLFNLLF